VIAGALHFLNKFTLAPKQAIRGLRRAKSPNEILKTMDEFGDHFGEHPKTAGRTFTGGTDFFLKEIFSQRLGVL
jgi:hypothetical protein